MPPNKTINRAGNNSNRRFLQKQINIAANSKNLNFLGAANTSPASGSKNRGARLCNHFLFT
jgi:hypothetical protein